VVVALALLSGFGFLKSKVHWGLDIVGGVQLTYQMVNPDKTPYTPKADATGKNQNASLEDIQQRILLVLTRRAGKDLGVNDAEVESKGDTQFIVRLPGLSNLQQAKDLMGTAAKITFYDAKNVNNLQTQYRPYNDIPTKDQIDVSFERTSDKKTIAPGTPEYADMIKGWTEIASGTDLTHADMEANQGGGGYMPVMSFGSAAAQRWRDWSLANNQTGEKIAAVMDGRVISIASIEKNAVLGEGIKTEGNFSTDYVKTLVELLNSGALPVDLSLTSSSNVDGTIGKEALNKIFSAGVIASVAIVAFMLLYYLFPGAIAVVALGLYILFTLTVLRLLDATFSLPAIAGFILSVGMAVDANILVFERLKEEMRSGKDLHRAMHLGFSRALPAIVDSNACTILTAVVLYNLGTGPVKGFATTLIIGVAISLFTAVVVTRSLLFFAVDSGLGNHPSWYGLGRQWFDKGDQKAPLQVVNKAGRYFLISAITIVPGVIFAMMGGLKGNVEFTGGTQVTYKLTDQTVTAPQIVSNLTNAGIKGSYVTLGSSGNTRLAYITIPPGQGIDENTKDATTVIAQKAGIPPQADAEIDSVSGTVQKETLTNAVWGVILSTGLIIVYLSLRFGIAMGGMKIGFRFAASAILALIHDVLVVIGLAALMGYLANWQVSALFISAMLTVIGFSTHDTIVIFDRIRENLRRAQPGEEVGNLINRSITQSIARSINTSGTVIFTLLILIMVGSATPELKLFNLAMLVGIISGTYSSIFNASPILYLWDKAIAKKNVNNTLLGITAADRITMKRTLTQQVPTYQAAPEGPTQATPGYSQVKRRRASDVERSKRPVDDDI
jgi:SecD/SecF fusion protein